MEANINFEEKTLEKIYQEYRRLLELEAIDKIFFANENTKIQVFYKSLENVVDDTIARRLSNNNVYFTVRDLTERFIKEKDYFPCSYVGQLYWLWCGFSKEITKFCNDRDCKPDVFIVFENWIYIDKKTATLFKLTK